MAAARPETIIMREAREAAREDGLRVTIWEMADHLAAMRLAFAGGHPEGGDDA